MRLGLSAGQPIPACSQLLSFALWQSNDIFGLSPAHRRRNRRSDRVGGAAQRVGVEVRMAVGRRGLRVSEQLADDGKPHGRACADAGEAVPQIVEAHAVEPSGLAYSGPRLFQIGTRRAFPLTGDDVRIDAHTRD